MQLYSSLVERADCVWGTTIFSCTVKKEISMERNSQWNILSQGNE